MFVTLLETFEMVGSFGSTLGDFPLHFLNLVYIGGLVNVSNACLRPVE